MSPYALELAHARIDALRALIDAMNEADTPEEKRRCAVAIFNAPEPNDFDDEIELADDEDDEEADDADQYEGNSGSDEDSEEDEDSEGEEGASKHETRPDAAPTSGIPREPAALFDDSGHLAAPS